MISQNGDKPDDSIVKNLNFLHESSSQVDTSNEPAFLIPSLSIYGDREAKSDFGKGEVGELNLFQQPADPVTPDLLTERSPA